MRRSPLLARLALGAAVLAPLAFVPGTWYPYVSPKAYLLHGAAIIACAVLAVRRVGTGGLFPIRPSPIALAVALWIGCTALSTVMSVDLERSLWGTPARRQGLVTLASAAALFVVAREVLRERADRGVLVGCLVGAGAVASVIGLADAAPGRPGGTLGNPVFLGGLGIHVAFLSAAAMAWSGSRAVRTFFAIAALLGLSAVVASETRGALLGLVVGGGVAAVAAIEALRDRPAARRALVLGCLAVAALTAGIWVARNTAVVSRFPLVRRLAAISTGEGTGGVRVAAWRTALEAAPMHPILGWGPECFQQAADAHYPPAFALVSAEPDLDDAHNAGLQALVTGGAVGLLAYLALVFAPIWALVRRRDEARLAALSAAALLGLLVAHFVHELLAPRDVAGLISWMVVLALVDAGAAQRTIAAGGRRAPRTVRVAIVAAAIVALVGAVIVPGVANVRHAAALDAVRAGRPDALSLHERALAVRSPDREAYASAFAEAAAAGMRSSLAAGRREDSRELARVAADELSCQALPARPLARPEIVSAVLALQRAALLDDRSDLTRSFERATLAHERLPRRPDLAFAMADLRAVVGDASGALRVARATRDGAPGVARWWWRLAAVHATLGDIEAARAVLQEARARGLRPDRAGLDLERALDAASFR